MPRLTVLHGDITPAGVDKLVNAKKRTFTPHWLLIPRGVAGALRRLAVELTAAEVFHRAALREIDCLALPLRGIGTAGVAPSTSFRILRNAWSDASHRPALTEIYISDFDLYTELLADLGWTEGSQRLRLGAFWDAHESFEEIWCLLPDSPAREALQAIIQIAAACHKLDQATSKNPAGMQRGMQTLLGTARDHLAQAHKPRDLQPGFSLHAPRHTLDELASILDDWRDGAPLESLRTRAVELTTTLADELCAADLLGTGKGP